MAREEYHRAVRRNRKGVAKEELEHSVDSCDDARVKTTLAELAKRTMFVKILGSYPNVSG